MSTESDELRRLTDGMRSYLAKRNMTLSEAKTLSDAVFIYRQKKDAFTIANESHLKAQLRETPQPEYDEYLDAKSQLFMAIDHMEMLHLMKAGLTQEEAEEFVYYDRA